MGHVHPFSSQMGHAHLPQRQPWWNTSCHHYVQRMSKNNDDNNEGTDSDIFPYSILIYIYIMIMVISSDRIRSQSLWRLAWFEMGWEDGIADPEKHGATTPFGRWLQLQMMNSIMSDIWCLHVLQLHLVNLVYDSIWDWSFRSILYIPYHTIVVWGP